ncbi:MAG TPA: hypothetical protein VMT43_11520 [Acidimicrobiales bacterium]|nr:hypothetical protein [Acidimicrobiales bacterium]
MTVRRCRVCTAVINTDVPEGGPAVEEPAARPTLDDHFDANVIDRQMQSARSKFGGGSGALAARLAAANGGEMPSSYTIAPAVAEPERSRSDLLDAAFSTPPPPEEEPFDPDALFRDLG